MIEITKIKDNRDTIEYTDEVISLSDEARKYLMSFAWCDKIVNGWLAKDWGYMLCIFYFEIVPAYGSGADNFVWIVVGDIPPAYIDIESATNELEVLKVYVDLMDEWINNIMQGKSVENSFPIDVEPTLKYADMLSSRVQIIKSDFIRELTLSLS